MNYLKQFIIQFSGLSLGKHEYDFEINDAFFESIESPEIHQGGLKVHMTLNKQINMLVLEFNIKGHVNVTCDRCADDFNMPVVSQNKLIIKFAETAYEETDEIIFIEETSHEIDVAQYIYEFINLALPIQKVHLQNEQGEDQCDPEVIKKLEEILSRKKNEDDSDPRWDALKNLN